MQVTTNRIDMKSYLVLGILFILSSCFRENDCSKDILVGESYIGKGYLLFFRTSQDGMGDFWFFPTCNDNFRRKNISQDELFINTNYKAGISFKMPLSGSQFAQVKEHFHYESLDTLSFLRKVGYVPVEISFGKIESSSVRYSKFDEKFNMELIRGQKVRSLSYIIVDNLTINSIEVLK
ncbi:MAG TPA: hypothetical protein VGE24_12245 [Emticicia sp.]